MNGYSGKILRVNLSERTYRPIATEDYQQWFGGHGIGSAIFFDIMIKERGLDLETIDGFSEQNVITIMTSPLCGSGAPGASARTEIQGIGVHSFPIGWFTRSGLGGRFAAMLKFAGWDGIVLEGAARIPVWLDIRDDKVVIRECQELQLWGMDTFQSQKVIWNFVAGAERIEDWYTPAGARFQTTQVPSVLTIGAAGEHRSRIASIIHDHGYAAGEGGFGGIWGAKNLKAISVIGTGDVHIANPAALLQARLWQKENYQFNLNKEQVAIPANPSDGHWPPPLPGDNWKFPMTKEGSRPKACVGCHSACRARYQSGTANETKCYTTAFYSYSHQDIPIDQQAVIERRAGDLSNLLGINSHELVYGIPYLIKLNRMGVLGAGAEIDCPLDFNTLGSYEFIEQLLKAIAYGDDGSGSPSAFGQALKEGFYRAAETWGRLSGEQNDLETGILSYPHWGVPLHLDPRFQLEWGYGSILSDRDICEHDFDFLHKNPTEAALSPFESPLVTAEQGVKIYTDKMTPYNRLDEPTRMLDYSAQNMYSEHIARLVAWHRHYTRFYKLAMLFCDWQYPDFVNPYAPEKIGSTGEAEPKFINAVIGSELTFEQGIELGRKIFNLDHAIWTLQGRHRDLVHFAGYIYSEPKPDQQGTSGQHLVPCYLDGKWEYQNVNVKDRKIDKNAFEEFKTRFYRLEGWDPDSGYPTLKTLQGLALEDVAAELEKRGKLGKDPS
ncbi:MAG: hypothetical protein JXA30_02200 [Deltaproteobacteria bacterium]|nr:hypothetical protein [Deltaproteobacteria bacterium]